MHHNTDEVQITAGESDPHFGGGEIIKPIDILSDNRESQNMMGKR